MSPQRIQRKRTKGWRKPDNTIYVGRGSKWGNPFVIGQAQVRTPGLDGSEWEHEGRLHKTSGQSHIYVHDSSNESFKASWHQVEDATPEQCVTLYQNYMTGSPEYLGDRNWKPADKTNQIRTELAGKDLMCWCPLDQPCHADVLLEIANQGDPK